MKQMMSVNRSKYESFYQNLHETNKKRVKKSQKGALKVINQLLSLPKKERTTKLVMSDPTSGVSRRYSNYLPITRYIYVKQPF
jgi:hypothetical protein